MGNKHLLVIEDEQEIRQLLEIVLQRQGFSVTAFRSAEDFHRHLGFHQPMNFDLLILDWMLPGQSGLDFLKDLRRDAQWKSLRVMMLTAKAEPNEVVQGFEEGSDDYLVKPFDMGVLVARVKALLRRGDVDQMGDLIEWRGLKVNTRTFEASFEGEKVPLTPTEFRLLTLMLKNFGRVFTREQLVQGVQGEGINVIGRTVDTHIFSLRKKLGSLGDSIETARGIGYRVGHEDLVT